MIEQDAGRWEFIAKRLAQEASRVLSDLDSLEYRARRADLDWTADQIACRIKMLKTAIRAAVTGTT